MEPNLGIHKYHQKKTAQMLEGKQWICNGEHLQMSDQEGIGFEFSFWLLNLDIIHLAFHSIVFKHQSSF